MAKLTLIIPAYNEADGAQQTVDKLRPIFDKLGASYELEVIFVDDGSKDDTGSILREACKSFDFVKIVPHDRNRGLGAALKTGFANATGDMVVTTDFDGTYDFSTIPTLVQQLIDDGVDIVTASPYHPQGKVDGVPPYRLLFSFGASLLYRILVKWSVHTWTALFRVYRLPVVKTIAFESNDFLAGTELLVYALRTGFTISEFPTVLRTRSFGQSSIKIARVTKAHLQFQLRILLGRIPSFKKPSESTS